MAFRVVFTPKAEAEIDAFAAYLADHSPIVADRIITELAEAITQHIKPRPTMWQYFFLTGAPYRAYLFKVSRRTAFWIVYSIDEEAEEINILRFWNGSGDPEVFDI